MTTVVSPERWKQRFRAPHILYSCLAETNPERGFVVTNHSGVFQIHAWDVPAGTIRQLTSEPVGKLFGSISPDGRYVYYLKDEMGNEIGHYVRVPFEGGQPEDVTPDLPPFASYGIVSSRDGRTLAFMMAGADGFTLTLMSLDDQARPGLPRQLYRSPRYTQTPLLSADGRMAAFGSTERSAKLQFNLLVVDTESGAVLADLWDGPETSLEVVGFAPSGDGTRLLASTNRSGVARPFIWNARTGQRQDFDLEHLEGDITPLAWYPDGQAVLLCQVHRAVQHLLRCDLNTLRVTPLDHPAGSFSYLGAGASFSAQGEIITTWEDSIHAPQVIALDGQTGRQQRILLAGGEDLPARPWQSVSFPSSDGALIQAWLALPEGEGPFPVILDIHGGPTGVQMENFAPSSQAWLDHGFAFLTINYHGSTTFGREFQDKIMGDLGHWEIEDIAAARNWLVNGGIADPQRIFVTGWSYGGYLTLLSLGRLPDYWAGGMAGIAIADWTLMYEDQAETLRGYQVAMLGGTPQEKPEAHRLGSPITYVENLRAPLLIIQGKNDTRCPVRQMEAYLDRLKQAGKSYKIIWFNAGHGSQTVEERIEHQEQMLQFVSQVLG